MRTPIVVGTSSAEWLTALGTVGAVVVALLLAGLPALVHWRRRPCLEFHLGQEEPHLRPVPYRGSTIEHIRVRVEVRNAGKLEARRVRGQVVRWWSQATGAHYEWIEYDIDPMPLRWVSAPLPEGTAPAAFYADLAPGVRDYLEVARYQKGSGQVALVAPDDRDRPFRLEANYNFVEYRIEVMVVAENAPVARCVFSFETSSEHLVSNVRRAQPPPADRTLRGGLLSILGAIPPPGEE